MQRKLFLALFIAAFVPELVLAVGKFRGKVTDAGTGEPLVGANVVVVGTQMGAATNVSGEFVILNVPAGTYTLRTTYVGYQAITISNLRVNNDLTTEANFQLPAEGVTVGTVEIVAERPLVNKSATNAVRIIDAEFFSKVPARGVNVALSTQPGVVFQNNNLYIRGGRPDEVGYRVEGVASNNVLFGGNGLTLTAESVEQIQVQAGGFNAEYGRANAGLVQTQLRTGPPDRWKVSVLGETDRFTSLQSTALNTHTYGYGDVTATAGGPVPGLGNKLRLFGSVENTFVRDPTYSVRSPYSFTVVTDPNYAPSHPPTGPDPTKDPNYRPDTLNINVGPNSIGGFNNLWSFAGTALVDLTPIQVRLAGSYSATRSQNTTFLANIFNTRRLPLNLNKDGFGNLRLSHVLSPTMFYEASFNYWGNSAITEDPDFQNNLLAYGDSAANAALGYKLRGTSYAFSNYGLWNGAFSLSSPGAPISGYAKTLQNSFGGKVDFTAQLKQHELKFGGEYTRYTIRRFAPAGVFGFAKTAKDYPGDANQHKREINWLTVGGTGADLYGFDIYGNQINSDVVDDNGGMFYLGPRKPVFAGAYVQDKIEFSDIILNLGLRFDYIDPASVDAVDATNLHFTSDNLIKASDLTKTAATKQISPRIGFSFPVTDRTVFHAQYGKFIQQTNLRDSYIGISNVAGLIKGGFFSQSPAGFGLKPTRTTQYEMGFAQQFSDVASFDVTAYYKDIQDQVQYTYIIPSAGAENGNYPSLINADFSTSKGVEFKFTLRRTNRLTAQINYTFADTRTTGSNPASVAGLWSAGSTVTYPKYVFPADFDQPHRGSVLFDYRFAKNDGGPVLEQLGLNLLLTFNSGHAMTRLEAQQRGPAPGDPRFRTPIEQIGASSTPWFFELDARLDKTFSVGLFDLNVYAYVINLLGTDNPVNAFFRTADPRNDGWFASAAGHQDAGALGQQYVDFYNAVQLGENSGNWGPPRQIRFGIKVDY